MRKLLREWRKGGEREQEYKGKKKEYREMCERKKKEESEEWMRRATEAKTEGQVWEDINKDRKRKKVVNEGIEMEEWRDYFMELLGGVEIRIVRGARNGRERDNEEDLGKEEIERMIRGMKEKAEGVDGIASELRKYGGKGIRDWVWGFCNKVWRGEGWPEGWKGLVVPIVKKGGGAKMEEYG